MLSIALLMTALGVSPPATSAAACSVGRLPIKDFLTVNRLGPYGNYYDGADPLWIACPELKREIPPQFVIANDEVRAQMRQSASISSKYFLPTVIYWIGIPKISADSRTAIVKPGYYCTGLCGATFVAHYVWTAEGWRRDGEIQMTSVS